MADDPESSSRDSKKKQRSEPPVLEVRDLVIGDMQPAGGGAFEAPVSLRLLVKGEPPREPVHYQFDVGGVPQPTGFCELGIDGLVSERLRFEAAGQPLRLRTQGYGSRAFLLRGSVELPRSQRKIVLVDGLLTADTIEIVLRRVGRDGSDEAGEIAYRDVPERYEITRVRVEPPKYLVVRRPRLGQVRQMRFFLPDDPDAADVTVTILPILPERPEPREGDGKKRREAARESGKEWMERIIQAARRPPEKVPSGEEEIAPKEPYLLGLLGRLSREAMGNIRRAVSDFRERRSIRQPAWKRRMRRRWRI